MRLSVRSWAGRAAVVAMGLSVVLAAVGTTSAQARPDDAGTPTTVMTRNVYLGADIQRPIAATAGKTGLAALVALGNSNVVTRAIVDRTSFPRRSFGEAAGDSARIGARRST